MKTNIAKKENLEIDDYIVINRCDVMSALVDINYTKDLEYDNLKLLLDEILTELVKQETQEEKFLPVIQLKRSASKHLIDYMKKRQIACYD